MATVIDITERTAPPKGISRMELWAEMGRIKTAETVFEEASRVAELEHYANRLHDAPHGAPWYSSLHASSFPGDDPRACERMLAYKLMGFPEKEPFSRMLRGTMIVGQACEDWNVGNLDLDHRLLTPPATADHQLRFEDADHWLTGSPDIIVLPPGWNRGHLIETKTKDLEIVAQMKAATRRYDDKHARQLRCGIGLANRISPKLWPEVVICQRTWRIALCQPDEDGKIDDLSYQCCDHGEPFEPGTCLMRLELEPIRTGSILYMGRDRPNQTAEYFFEHDEEWFRRGLDAVDRVRVSFQRDEIPAHPFGGKEWSKQPCFYCDLKRDVCKPDHQSGTTKLSESVGVALAEQVYGSYDVEEIMRTVTERWSGRSGVQGVMPESH